MGGFSLHTTIGAGFLSLTGVYFESRKLQGTCFVYLVRLLLGDDTRASLSSALLLFGKEKISTPKQVLPKWEKCKCCITF